MLNYTKVKEINGIEIGYFYLPSSNDYKVMAFDNKKQKQKVISYEGNLEGVNNTISSLEYEENEFVVVVRGESNLIYFLKEENRAV